MMILAEKGTTRYFSGKQEETYEGVYIMNIEINKSYTITNITQKEFDMFYAGICCLTEELAQEFNKDIKCYDIRELAENISYNASVPLRTHKEKWEYLGGGDNI